MTIFSFYYYGYYYHQAILVANFDYN